jgi:cytochrome c oxidase assembly factor CtaG
MAEHLLLGDSARCSSSSADRAGLQPLLKRRSLTGCARLAHPVPALTLWALNLFAWHLAVLHEAALEHASVHALQHALFVALGVNMWMPLFGPLPDAGLVRQLAKLGYIVGVRLLGALLANVLLWTETPLYDGYEVADRAADQSAAASLMMVEGSLLTLVCSAGCSCARPRGEERQELVELGADPARAARAVAAGRGAELRSRYDTSGLPESKAGDEHRRGITRRERQSPR